MLMLEGFGKVAKGLEAISWEKWLHSPQFRREEATQKATFNGRLYYGLASFNSYCEKNITPKCSIWK